MYSFDISFENSLCSRTAIRACWSSSLENEGSMKGVSCWKQTQQWKPQYQQNNLQTKCYNHYLNTLSDIQAYKNKNNLIILILLISYLILSWRRPLPYRNQSTNLQSKLMDWFRYDNGLRHERLKVFNVRSVIHDFSNSSDQLHLWLNIVTVSTKDIFS